MAARQALEKNRQNIARKNPPKYIPRKNPQKTKLANGMGKKSPNISVPSVSQPARKNPRKITADQVRKII
jgi:hypothetical protein